MAVRTPIGRARGLGSAKEGTHHWWMQRVTAIALVPLALWFVASVASMAGADYVAMRAWVGQPITATLLISLIVATFYHAALGMQVVYEDYVHPHWVKVVFDIATKLVFFAFAVACIFSILKLAFAA